MPSPFPGMDPWLEDVDVWHGVHARLIARSSDLLQPQLRLRGFFVDIEERIYIEEGDRHVVPDLAVIERPRTPPQADAAILEADEPAASALSASPKSGSDTYKSSTARAGS